MNPTITPSIGYALIIIADHALVTALNAQAMFKASQTSRLDATYSMAPFTTVKTFFIILFGVSFFVQLPGTSAAARGPLHTTAAALGEDPKPIWHMQFSIDFNGE